MIKKVFVNCKTEKRMNLLKKKKLPVIPRMRFTEAKQAPTEKLDTLDIDIKFGDENKNYLYVNDILI